MSRATRVPGVLALILLPVLLATACDSSGGSGASPGASSASSTVRSSPASPSPSPSSASASASARPPVATAADGSRYAACADGNCEVTIAHPGRIRIRGGTFSVTKIVAGKTMDFRLDLSGGGGGSGTLAGACGGVVTFYFAGGVGTVTCGAEGRPQPPKPVPDALSLQLVGWTGSGAAVLRMVTG